VDWGDTLMRDLPFGGPMEAWPRLEVLPGANAKLHGLRSALRIVLVTNAADSDEAAIWRALRRAGIAELLDRVFCARSIGARKPSPEFYRTVLARLGVAPADAVAVGDDWETDVLGARSVEMRVVWLSEDRHRALPAGVARAATWRDVPAALGRLGFPPPASGRAAP
jgi:putative hydrolase of the HAD superfamily